MDLTKNDQELGAASRAEALSIFILHGSHHLTDHHFNGDGLVAWGFITALAERGHTLYVATDRLNIKGPVPENVTLVEFPRRFKSMILHYASYSLSIRAYFSKLQRTTRIDVAHQMNPVIRGLSLALLGKRIPIVLGTYVGDWPPLSTSPFYRKPTLVQHVRNFVKLAVDSIQQHFATLMVLATPHALKRIAVSGDVGDRIAFMHHGVDTVLYSPVERPGDPPDIHTSILYVGSVHFQKGIATLVDAFTLVCSQLPNATLVVVGDGGLLNSMIECVRALGLDERVRFVGRQSRSEVAGWLRASDILCAPSYGEPYGQNVLEAMATGKPVVLTDQGGHKYLGDDVGTVAIRPGDSAHLAEVLVTLLKDAPLRLKMGEHNRHIALERYSWSTAGGRLERIYRNAISLHALRDLGRQPRSARSAASH